MVETLSCQESLRTFLIINPIASVATTMVKAGARIRGRMSPRSRAAPNNAAVASVSNTTCQYGSFITTAKNSAM